MPIIEVHIAQGRSMDAKRQLFKGITNAAVESLGVRPEQVRIILREIDEGHFAVGGEPKLNVFGIADAAE